MSFDPRAELLFIGRPVPEKGLGDLLVALSSLRHYAWHLTVVGQTPPDLDTGALAPHLTFLGCIPNRQIANVMAARDVLVVPSHYETFGNVALEGLACGMVVVASYTGGLKTLVRHGETGFHFTARDVEALRQTLALVLKNLDKLTVLRQNARTAALDYSWDVIVRRTTELLNRFV